MCVFGDDGWRGGAAVGPFPHIVPQCRSISDNTPPWKTRTFPRSSVPTGPKVFICIDYRLHVLFSLISIVLQMHMYAFNYQANLPSSNSHNIGSGTAHKTRCCSETSPGCCAVSLTVRRKGFKPTLTASLRTTADTLNCGRSLLSVLWFYCMRVVRPEKRSEEEHAQLYEERGFCKLARNCKHLVAQRHR